MVTQCLRCQSRCDPNKCETCDGNGNCIVCNDDPNKTCCISADGSMANCCDANEICCDGVCHDPATEGDWKLVPTDSLPIPCYGLLPCDGADGPGKTDDCGNNIRVMCAQADGTGGPLGCAYRFFYNGVLISSCDVWVTDAENTWCYKETNSGLITKIMHITQDSDCDEGCPGKSCARVAIYNCITGVKTVYWRRVDCPGGEPTQWILDVNGPGIEECPVGHEPE
jgi:hypothetical protein